MSVKVREPVCEDSAQDLYIWFDHFLGDQIKDEWNSTIVGAGTNAVVDQQTGGIVRLTTGGINGDNNILDWNDIRSLLVSKRVSIEFKAKLDSITSSSATLDLLFNVNNRVSFYATLPAEANWLIWCRDGGASTQLDSGIAVDTDYHIFRSECHTHGGNHVHFYIDGVETANSPITTNIPDDAADYLQPRLFRRTAIGAVKSMDVDYVVVRQDR